MTQRSLAWVALAGGMLVVLFWACYFSGAIPLADAGETIREFEAAFPIADGLLAATLLAASRALSRDQPAGPFLLIVGAAMCVYLGVLDVTFYSRQGLYRGEPGDWLVELAVNLLTIGGGSLGLYAGWRLWRARFAGSR